MKECAVLFVCLGNICRSPLAEGIFRDLVIKAGLEDKFRIDSCGTGPWHVGEPPHIESINVANKHGVSLDGQIARQVKEEDFSDFDYIVAMDRSNLRDLKNLYSKVKRSSLKNTPEMFCLRKYDSFKGSDLDVPDPYYGGPDGFELVFEIIYRCCDNFLKSLPNE